MKIALAQLNYHIGNFSDNINKMAFEIRNAREKGVDLVIFSELSVCGYPPLDLLEYKWFVDKCERAVQSLAKICTDVAVIIGTPTINHNPAGKSLFNSACFIYEGEVKATVHKTLLPTYDIFDEYRYFESNNQFQLIEFKGKNLAITICEDLWDNQPSVNALGREQLYVVSPMDELQKLGPDLVINIAASPFSVKHEEVKKNIFTDHARKLSLPVIYVNQVGAQTELIFDGGSMVVKPDGEIALELSTFEEDVQVVELEAIAAMPTSARPQAGIPEKIHEALILGIRDYFGKMGLMRAVVGLSGGVDSALTLVLAARALGADNVDAILMPSRYSSDHSVNDAVELAERLGINYHIISIEPIFEAFRKSMHPLFQNLPENLAEENIQARIRGNILMAYSNKFGHILLNTSNKSEAAVGYGTLYGDMAGGLSVLGDVYKTQVYQVCNFINAPAEVIPVNTLTKPPSAELRPNQKDSDSLPDYPILDQILFHYIEEFRSPEDIIENGFDEELVLKVLGLVNKNEYKRYQTPPILRISRKSFGPGRKMPIVARY
ncbi:MAG: NAD+ synthase [Bacteroidales bacterium]